MAPSLIAGVPIFPPMEEARDDAGAAYGEAPGGPEVVYRGPQTQREVDAILARLRAWRDRGRTV